MKYLKVESLNQNPKVQVVTLARSDVKNAFHPEMISEITECFQKLAEEHVDIVFLRGEGSVFCAGADLNWMKEMIQYSYDQNIKDSEKLWEMFEAISHCPAFVIAVAHGAVYGGALGLLACCDQVYIEERTQLCFSEVKLGLAPAVISSFILRKLPDIFIRPLMLSAEVFQAEKAIQVGLAHQKYSQSIDLSVISAQLLSLGSEAIKETKKLINQISFQNLSWSEQKRKTTQVISERRMSIEGQNRLKNFLAK